MRTIRYTAHGLYDGKLRNSNDLRFITKMDNPIPSATKVRDIRYLAKYYPESLAARPNQRGKPLRRQAPNILRDNSEWIHEAALSNTALGHPRRPYVVLIATKGA